MSLYIRTTRKMEKVREKKQILQKVAEEVNIPFEKVMTNMDKYANTSGGTIPIVLDETYKSGKIKEGNTLLFAAVGSGWTWGAALYKV